MRALFFNQDLRDFDSSKILVDGDKFHHLTNVLRIKKDDEILVITKTPGKGLKTVVESISKKSLILSRLEEINQSKKFNIDLALGIPKKEALEEIIRSCSEMGVNKIIPVSTQYSWSKYQYNERFEKIIISAVEQSNNFYYPEFIQEPLSLGQIEFSSYESIIYFSSDPKFQNNELNIVGKTLLIVGPEGGFSNEEEIFLQSQAQCRNIEIPIMRARTAVPFLIGYTINSLNSHI